jgi:hypothetical protein
MRLTDRRTCLTEVRVMTTRSMLICSRNIVTYYDDEIRNEERAKKIVQAQRARKNRIIPLVAEEVAKGEYVLIENFTYYSALLKAQPEVRVPCLVDPGTSDEERLIHILKISIPLGSTGTLPPLPPIMQNKPSPVLPYPQALNTKLTDTPNILAACRWGTPSIRFTLLNTTFRFSLGRLFNWGISMFPRHFLISILASSSDSLLQGLT